MAKDPSVLFYTSDFLTGTSHMTNSERGFYIQLLCHQQQRGVLSLEFIKRLGGVEFESLWPYVKEKFLEDKDGFFNDRMRSEIDRRQKYTESRRQSRSKADESQVRVYLVRDNISTYYKIGSSVNPMRRYNELSFQENPAILINEKQRDLTLVWYSATCLRIEEKRLHDYFKSKNIKGEWFKLNEEDLGYIFSSYE